tara:strand:+ start:1553 stop:2098 length:546 start_codon:yes stop_codon:yes gene_type:complete
MKLGYADPPYVGQSKLYKDHPDYDGEVDHEELLARLVNDYDGFILHTSAPALGHIIDCCRKAKLKDNDYRIMAWVKPFAAFKKNVPVAYAWEPIIVKCLRKPIVTERCVMRDFISEPITMRKGLVGAKPPRLIKWLFEVAGCSTDDELDDIFPGTGIVGTTWKNWKGETYLGDMQGTLWTT